MALTPFPSSVGWDKIRTHDLLIVNLVCYPLDQAFALRSYLNFQSECRILLQKHSNENLVLQAVMDEFEESREKNNLTAEILNREKVNKVSQSNTECHKISQSATKCHRVSQNSTRRYRQIFTRRH